eukprot:gene29930-30046_t
MGTLLGTYATLRDRAWKALGLEWDPEQEWWRRALPRVPVDAACGGAAAAAACYVSHAYRQADGNDCTAGRA